MDPSSTREINRKAPTEIYSPLNKETVITLKSSVIQEYVYINPENSDLGLMPLFKADNVGTMYLNLKPPPVDSGTTALRMTLSHSDVIPIENNGTLDFPTAT